MDKELKFYSILLIAISTIFYTISIFVSQFNILKFGTPIFMIIYGVAGYSPAIAALITIKRYKGKGNGFRLFLKSIINKNQDPFMYVYILYTPVILWVSSYVAYRLQGGDLPLLQSSPYLILLLIPITIIGGGLEEIGWRGFLLPKLLERFSPLISTLIVGCVWSAWHIPMWFILGSHQQSIQFIPFALSCIATSFIMTPLFFKTRSIWLCILLHAIDNACGYLFYISVDSNYIVSLSTLVSSIIIFYIFMYILGWNKKYS